MIVVLCDSFEDAQDGYDIFVSFLEDIDPFLIKKTCNASYCVETDDDLRYIFVDYRFRPLFQKFEEPVDEIDLDRFLNDIEEIYWW